MPFLSISARWVRCLRPSCSSGWQEKTLHSMQSTGEDKNKSGHGLFRWENTYSCHWHLWHSWQEQFLEESGNCIVKNRKLKKTDILMGKNI